MAEPVGHAVAAVGYPRPRVAVAEARLATGHARSVTSGESSAVAFRVSVAHICSGEVADALL